MQQHLNVPPANHVKVLDGQGWVGLIDHLGSGKVWDLSRKRGGLRLLPPFNYQKEWGIMPFRGKIEALAGVRSYLENIRQAKI